MKLEKFSLGVGDRFAHQAKAQLQACAQAAAAGVTVVPVWNKSNREHNIVHSEPSSVREAADAAVRALSWKAQYCVDADHINLKTVDRFLAPSDFFTLDVADSIGRPPGDAAIDEFLAKHPELIGRITVNGIDEPLEITREMATRAAQQYLFAVKEAGEIYRYIESKRGKGQFITEVSMDETDAPQTPPELLLILAAIADERIPIQTIAPKFTGRFNKGVDYVGDAVQFEKEFSDDLAVIRHAVGAYGLPDNLKLSVHSGSDKFSIYGAIKRGVSNSGAGVHVKTAGTTWLEELIGLAEAGGDGLKLAKDIYKGAHEHANELCAPYASVIDIDTAKLPAPAEVAGWSSDDYTGALRHDQSNPAYNLHLRQLLHVGYKIAANMGDRYTGLLKECEATIARNVTTNLYDRHIVPISESEVLMISRRALFLGAAAFAAAPAAVQDEVKAILARIKPPVFPRVDFPITKYGAVTASDATEAIRKAIAACSAAGGGRVTVPKGEFLTGPIHLKSNVNLVVEGTLKFSRDPKQYLPLVFSRWEGMECMNYSPFIYAYEQSNIAITGTGTLDGQASGESWWPWKGQARHGYQKGGPNQAAARDQLIAMVEKQTPVSERKFGEGSFLRPQFIQPYKCKNVLIQGVTILNSPMWEVHPVLCSNVSILQVKIKTHGPNNDGCDPESCRDVLIMDCEFDTGDDCIAIKSGRNQDGRRVPVPSENIVITGCTMKAGHGGVTIGSEISAGVRNVFVDNCQMSSPDLNSALRFKNNATRGGVIEHIRANNLTIGQVGVALEVDFLYEEGARGGFKPVVRDVVINGMRCGQAKSPWVLRGLPEAPVENIRFEDCTFEHATKESIAEHVRGLTFKNVSVNGKVLS